MRHWGGLYSLLQRLPTLSAGTNAGCVGSIGAWAQRSTIVLYITAGYSLSDAPSKLIIHSSFLFYDWKSSVYSIYWDGRKEYPRGTAADPETRPTLWRIKRFNLNWQQPSQVNDAWRIVAKQKPAATDATPPTALVGKRRKNRPPPLFTRFWNVRLVARRRCNVAAAVDDGLKW